MPTPGDMPAARELKLFIENDSNLYRQMRSPIEENLYKKAQRGTYDSAKARKAWLNLANRGAQVYTKENGGSGYASYGSFSPQVRRSVAAEMAQEFENQPEVADEIRRSGIRKPSMSEQQATDKARSAIRNAPSFDVKFKPGDRIPGTDFVVSRVSGNNTTIVLPGKNQGNKTTYDTEYTIDREKSTMAAKLVPRSKNRKLLGP